VPHCCPLSVSVGALTKQYAGGNFALGAGYCVKLRQRRARRRLRTGLCSFRIRRSAELSFSSPSPGSYNAASPRAGCFAAPHLAVVA